jgi:hypothetical protein
MITYYYVVVEDIASSNKDNSEFIKPERYRFVKYWLFGIAISSTWARIASAIEM